MSERWLAEIRKLADMQPPTQNWDRVPAIHPRKPPRSMSKPLVIAAALAVFAVAIAGLWIAIGPTRHGSPAHQLGHGHPVTVTLHDPNYPLKCSATIASDVVDPGTLVDLRIDVSNRGPSSVQYLRELSFLTIDDSNGKLLAESTANVPPSPGELAPGRTDKSTTVPLAIKWAGSLRLSTRCPSVVVGGRPTDGPMLPSIPVSVSIPGPTPTPEDAIRRAAASTDGLFGHCIPSPDGSPTDGTVSALQPSHPSPPTSTARCWASVEQSDGFDVVTLSLGSPAEAFPSTLTRGFPIQLKGSDTSSAIQWEFVVTPHTVTSVEQPLKSESEYALRRPGTEFRYDWIDGAWSTQVYAFCTPDVGGGGSSFMLFAPSPPKCDEANQGPITPRPHSSP